MSSLLLQSDNFSSSLLVSTNLLCDTIVDLLYLMQVTKWSLTAIIVDVCLKLGQIVSRWNFIFLDKLTTIGGSVVSKEVSSVLRGGQAVMLIRQHLE